MALPRPAQVQPSELAKLGAGAVGRRRAGPQGRGARALAGAGPPAVPGGRRCCSSWSATTTWAPCSACWSLFVGLLWAAGVRLRVFAALGVIGLAGIGLLIAAASWAPAPARRENYRLGPAHRVPQPARRCDAQATAATRSSRAVRDRQRRLVRRRAGQGHAQVGLAAQRRTTTSSSRVIAEELGVVGCVVVLALFAVLAYTGLRIARRVGRPVPPARRRRRSPPGSSARP